MLSKRFFLGLFAFSFIPAMLLSIYFSNFLSFSKSDKVIVQPESIALQKLSSTSPLMRRQGILQLKVSGSFNSIKPLFCLLMSNNISENDVILIAQALYTITQGKIIETTLDILNLYANKKWNPLKKNSHKIENSVVSQQNLSIDFDNLTKQEILALLEILSNMSIADQKTYKDRLQFINQLILNETSKDIVYKALVLAGTIKNETSYHVIKDLFTKDFFFKIGVIHSLQKIVLSTPVKKDDFEKFLINVLKTETHPDIQQEAEIAIYLIHQEDVTNQHLSSNQEDLIRKISLLNSKNLSAALEAENMIGQLPYQESQKKIYQYFVSYKGSHVVRFRLLTVLKNYFYDIPLVDIDVLEKNIQERYNLSNNPYATNIAQTSLFLLASPARKLSNVDIKRIFDYVNDKNLLRTSFFIYQNLLKNKKTANMVSDSDQSFYKNIIAQLIYKKDFVEAAELIYQIQGVESMIKMLENIDISGKQSVLDNWNFKGIQATDLEKIILHFQENMPPHEDFKQSLIDFQHRFL